MECNFLLVDRRQDRRLGLSFLTLSSPNGISSSDQNSVCRNFRSATAAVIALLPRSCDRTSTVHLRS